MSEVRQAYKYYFSELEREHPAYFKKHREALNWFFPRL